jgi:hypothetical protein
MVSCCAAGFRQLFITGLQPIRGVKLTLPTSADCSHDSHTPDQVRFQRPYVPRYTHG